MIGYDFQTCLVPDRVRRAERVRLHEPGPTASEGHKDVRGLAGVSQLPPGHLRPVADHVDGQCREGSRKRDPKAIIADFATPNPLVTFTPADVAFTYGNKWKQRYWKKQGDDYFVFPAQWDIRHKMWRPYHVQKGTDWWVEHYPEAQEERPTGPLCDGCHSVNYDIKTHAVTEWNVGLRALPWCGRRPRRAPGEIQHRQPQSPRRCAGERRVHPMPLTGPAAGESDRGSVLRLARGISAR